MDVWQIGGVVVECIAPCNMSCSTFSHNSVSIAQTQPELANKSFMLTGKLDGMSRAEAKSVIELNSGSIVSNVSKKLDYLIIGEKPTKRKIESAKELKVRILTQKEWSAMLKKTS